jgi:hypothetical protein
MAEWLTLLKDRVHKTCVGGAGGSRLSIGVGDVSCRFRFIIRESRRRPVTLSSAVVSPVSICGCGVVSSCLMTADPSPFVDCDASSIEEAGTWGAAGRGVSEEASSGLWALRGCRPRRFAGVSNSCVLFASDLLLSGEGVPDIDAAERAAAGLGCTTGVGGARGTAAVCMAEAVGAAGVRIGGGRAAGGNTGLRGS